ncbi:ABC-2 type transporter-domain-containing protein [Halteromyces radiatus]|uniref:ABC-2 type transporter-domain-containing protein n=1 Tax=Halteromyces radiatus TaxID=101107 RepID=UPI00221F8CEA|nr:ABC-2 type transporter-domain-containing protein [Halteromyces radiatus]KAI8099010.1 ABC-2 type transporter-domain-containing protein [Halteromyces radiatus]
MTGKEETATPLWENKKVITVENIEDRVSIDTAIGDAYQANDTYGEPTGNAVNIEAALTEYHDLKKELSRISRMSTNASKLEEGTTEDQFDLDQFLKGMSNDNSEAGQLPKHLGVIWRDLEVKGLAADAHTIPNVFNFIGNGLQVWKRFGIGLGGNKKTILHKLNGFCKDGEMLLVLGRPGAGCTSLLKVLANMRGSFTDVNGSVSFGGIDPTTFAKEFQGQTCYNEEEDLHFPTLTAKQTLQFALRTKTPGNRLPEETKTEFVNKILYMLGNMLGLTKQMNTKVGNAFIRGLSGGERKRLSIAEHMTTSSSINCWDCSTRGLDAASALDYVRSLRIMTDVFNKTTIATLYQASNSIFDTFDKILLLDEGRCIYFGPVGQAKRYFEDLGFYCPPRKSTPDFLTGLCNPLERETKPGFEKSVPQNAEEFEQRFIQSNIYADMMNELDAFEEQLSTEKQAELFRQAVDQEHQKRASRNAPYTASFYQQVKALTIRQYHLLITDSEALISRYGTILIQGLITASCFYMNPLNGTGAFSRAGAIFFSVIFNSFVSQSELVRFMIGRPILEKHKQFALYRPSAFYISQVLLDVPFAVAQVLLFEICTYFMMGLNLDAGRFFTYFIIMFFINMSTIGFFRFFGAVSPSFFVATQLSSVIIITFYNYTGYIISYNKMHPWLFWIYWMNPLAYGTKALLINEMENQVYSCDGPGNSVPYGPEYTDWNYKTCTMQGGIPGQSSVSGSDYLLAALSYKPWEKWAPDFVVVVAFFLFFTVITALAMDFSAVGKSSTLTRLYLPGKAPKQRTAEEENERRLRQAKVIENMDNISTGTTFSWHHVNYTVPIKGGSLQLLNDISGIVKPGHLTALMGSSGAGKTTLLDVLARRKTIGKVDGRTYLNGEILMNDFERITGYCEQMDVHQPAVTVREALRFSAYLRQPADVSRQEKNDYVETILQLLEMEDIADAQIGDVESGFGISVEERKRLTIGMELVGKPQLLFLDEPTSGLDAQSSFNIVRFIRKLADAGWPVLCTIHQPSAILFDHFDHLLLLVRGGRTAYYGEIGPDARVMIDYFERNGGPVCHPEANPAEYILEVVGAGTTGKVTKNWADVWSGSNEAKALENELEQIHQSVDPTPSRKARTYATSLWTQFVLVHKRMALSYWRSPEYNVGRFLNIMVVAIITGFTYWKLGHSTSDLQNKLFALFTTFIMAFTIIILAQPKFMTERVYFRREYASRYYSWLPWSISAVLVEIPYILFYSAFFMFGLYWTSGMKNTSEAVGYFYLVFSTITTWSATLGYIIAAIAEAPTMAAVLNPLIMSILVLFCGLMQLPSAMPRFWSAWMYWLDPFHYYIEGLTVNEMENIAIHCTPSDLIRFTPPPGQTCAQYTEAFFNSTYGVTGYIENPQAMQPEQCGYCLYSTGEQFFETNYAWAADHKWRNFGILLLFLVSNILSVIALVYLRRKPRR